MIKSSTFYVTRKSPSSSWPVSLLEIKQFLRIEHSLEDALLSNLLSIATEYAEWYMEKSLMPQKWQVSYIRNIPQRIQIPFSPIINVEEVNMITFGYNVNTIPKDQYFIDDICSCIVLSRSISAYRLDIIYQAGYQDISLIPAQIKEGIMHHVANSYKNRESSSLDAVKDFYEPFCSLKLVL